MNNFETQVRETRIYQAYGCGDSEFKVSTQIYQDNASEHVIEIMGMQYDRTKFEKTENGFKITLIGNIEFDDFINRIAAISTSVNGQYKTT